MVSSGMTARTRSVSVGKRFFSVSPLTVPLLGSGRGFEVEGADEVNGRFTQ